jgi:hypothetical protein
VPEESLEQMKWEIARIKDMGIKLNLLLNASCYGEKSMSTEIAEETSSLIRELMDIFPPDSVTTMSPVIAKTVRKQFPQLEMRASVNMRIGTVKGMSYVSDTYDSYCIQREFNYDLQRLAELQEWAHNNGKTLHVLANSGCMNFCAFQTFHDNAVSHEAQINARKNTKGIATLCREYYSDPKHMVNFLSGSSYIRPEDISRHSEIFSGNYKLATRMHSNPRLVIHAYAEQSYKGDLLALTEPGFGDIFYPYIVDNSRFPYDWMEKILGGCGKNSNCEKCTYCSGVLDIVLVNIEEKLKEHRNILYKAENCV